MGRTCVEARARRLQERVAPGRVPRALRCEVGAYFGRAMGPGVAWVTAGCVRKRTWFGWQGLRAHQHGLRRGQAAAGCPGEAESDLAWAHGRELYTRRVPKPRRGCLRVSA